MNRWLLAIVCFFLGMFGIHRFAVGKFWTGLLYLFTAGLFAIGWIVDLVMIIMGIFTDSTGKQIK